MALAFLLRDLFNSLRIRINNHFEQNVIYDMRRDVFAKLQRLPVSYFDKRASGDLMTRVVEDINNVERVLIDGTEQGTVAILCIGGISGILFYTNHTLAAVALSPLPFLAAGALSALFRAQILYTLPVSIFAMSVAAAELPELSRLSGDPALVANRANAAMRRIAFWMLAASLLLIAAGEPLIALLFQGGEFTSADTSLVWLILVFYAIGLPATGLSRMLQNASYAIGDTSGPARIAALRVSVAALIGLAVMFPLDRAFIGPDGVERLGDALGFAGPLEASLRQNDGVVRLGAVGLAIGSAVGAWLELFLLSRLLDRRLPRLRAPSAVLLPPALAAALAFASTAAVKLVTSGLPSAAATVATIGVGGFLYVVVCFRTGVRESHMVLKPARKVIWRR